MRTLAEIEDVPEVDRALFARIRAGQGGQRTRPRDPGKAAFLRAIGVREEWIGPDATPEQMVRRIPERTGGRRVG